MSPTWIIFFAWLITTGLFLFSLTVTLDARRETKELRKRLSMTEYSFYEQCGINVRLRQELEAKEPHAN